MSNRRCLAVAELAVNLSRIAAFRFPDGSIGPAVFRCADVAAKLTSLELSAQRAAERECSVPMPEGQAERARERIRRRVAAQIARLFPVHASGCARVLHGMPGLPCTCGVGDVVHASGKGYVVAPTFEISGDPRGACLRLFHASLPKNSMGDGYAVGA